MMISCLTATMKYGMEHGKLIDKIHIFGVDITVLVLNLNLLLEIQADIYRQLENF